MLFRLLTSQMLSIPIWDMPQAPFIGMRNGQVHLQRGTDTVTGSPQAGPCRGWVVANTISLAAAQTAIVRIQIREWRETLGPGRTSTDLYSSRN
jgi:hypothetical protein